MDTLQKQSYEAHHGWLNQRFPDDDEKRQVAHRIFGEKNELSKLRSSISYCQILPLIQKSERWGTMGDCYGTDAAWIGQYCEHVTAMDIQDSFLKIAKEKGFIKEYLLQNAEKITIADNTLDYFLCKEAFHHFPRPYIAVYEMLRCSRKGVIFQEPVDPQIKMPALLLLCNMLDTKRNPTRSSKFWKNRFSFEEVGNYVYKVSQREFEKIAMGIGLPAVAFYYFNEPYVNSTSIKKYKRKLWIRNLLCKLRIIPYQKVTTILFKEIPDEKTKKALLDLGYFYYELPLHALKNC